MTQSRRQLIENFFSETVDFHKTAAPSLDRFLQKISKMDIPGREHVENYLRYKWRMNHKPSTLKGSLHATSSFLSFYASQGKACFQEVVSDDVEAFVEYAQDSGLKAATIRTRLNHLWAFLRYLIEQDVIGERILKRKISIKVPEFLPRAIAVLLQPRAIAESLISRCRKITSRP